MGNLLFWYFSRAHCAHFSYLSIFGKVFKNGIVFSKKMVNEKSFFHQRYWYFSRYDSLINQLILFHFFHLFKTKMPYLCPSLKKKHLLMWACSLQVRAVRFTSHRLKYWLLIGGICLMRNFVVASTDRRTERCSDLCSLNLGSTRHTWMTSYLMVTHGCVTAPLSSLTLPQNILCETNASAEDPLYWYGSGKFWD